MNKAQNIVNIKTLEACSKGLKKRIRNAKTKKEKSKIEDIKEEIDYLIDNL